MLSLLAHVVAEVLYRPVACGFWRLVKRFPAVLAAAALPGTGVGVWLVRECVPAGDWLLAGIGVGCAVFYPGLFAMLAVKIRAGTWGDFCDWAASLVA